MEPEKLTFKQKVVARWKNYKQSWAVFSPEYLDRFLSLYPGATREFIHHGVIPNRRRYLFFGERVVRVQKFAQLMVYHNYVEQAKSIAETAKVATETIEELKKKQRTPNKKEDLLN